MTKIVRPARITDLDQLLELAASLGPGMTTFPADRPTLARKLEATEASFSGMVTGADAQYLMVLVDYGQEVLGVSAVYPSIGHPHGFFSYHLERLIQHSPLLDTRLDTTILTLSNAYTGLTEIGTLAVKPVARAAGAGRLLARSRYMLMAAFPHLFADRVIAEMRGWLDIDGRSPFWSAVGERFFKLPFADADAVSAQAGAGFIADLIPKFPLYLDLLPEEARKCVGRAHDTSAIAMKMLLDEGFRFEGYVDVFDAGPQVIAETRKISTIAHSSRLILGSGPTPPSMKEAEVLCATTDLASFRLSRCTVGLSEATIVLPDNVRQALEVEVGSSLMVALA